MAHTLNLENCHLYLLSTVLVSQFFDFIQWMIFDLIFLCDNAHTLLNTKANYSHSFGEVFAGLIQFKHSVVLHISILAKFSIDSWRTGQDRYIVGVAKTNDLISSGLRCARYLRWFPHKIRAIVAKIKLPKNPYSMVIFWIMVRRSYQDLSSQADPARENWTWSFIYFTQNGRFALVENTGMKHSQEVWHWISRECLGFSSRGHLEKWTTVRSFK